GLVKNCRYAFLARESSFADGLKALLNALLFGITQSINPGAPRLNFACQFRKLFLILLGPGRHLLQQFLSRRGHAHGTLLSCESSIKSIAGTAANARQTPVQ